MLALREPLVQCGMDSECSQLEGGAQEDCRGVGTVDMTLLGKAGGGCPRQRAEEAKVEGWETS